MRKIEEGGPAFAAMGVGPAGDVYHETGMSLRDWFAGQALVGLISSSEDHFRGDTRDEAAITKWRAEVDRQWAAYCYDMADAMLAARKGGE